MITPTSHGTMINLAQQRQPVAALDLGTPRDYDDACLRPYTCPAGSTGWVFALFPNWSGYGRDLSMCTCKGALRKRKISDSQVAVRFGCSGVRSRCMGHYDSGFFFPFSARQHVVLLGSVGL